MKEIKKNMFLKYLIFLTFNYFILIQSFSFDEAVKIHLNGHESSINTVPTTVKHFFRSKREINLVTGKSYAHILINNEKITFELENTKHLLLSDTVEDDSNCVFQGKSIKPNSTFTAALTGCGKDMQGIILTESGDHYILKSLSVLTYSNNNLSTHTIQKRSVNIHEYHSCGFDISSDPYPEDRHHSADPSFLGVHNFQELIIELGVFVDDAMWQFFEKFYGDSAEKEVKRFVIATVNNIDILFTRSTIEPKVRLKITHFEILKTMPMSLTRTYHNSGDVTKMLNSFCTYQSSINPKNDADPKHWDHALLLTGYDLYRNNVKTIAGYAPVKGMCEQFHNKSCTVNEGLDFGAVFVITHEMGHSLGMLHDGESNQCQPRCCIMSPSIGAGKTQWSGCSVNELHTFVSRLGTGDRPMNCLMDDAKLTLQNEKLYLPDKTYPGQQYSLDEQCSLFHGTCWKQDLQTGQTLKDVCQMLWCSNGDSVVRNTHPALEGSYCSSGRICIEGKCVAAASKNISPIPINGGWGSWDDASKCSQGCNDCKIEGQLRVKRSVRMCNNPFKNNGGRDCPGSDIRGLICGTQACHGQTIDNYATSKCTALKSDPNLFYIGLNGKGLQFAQAPCKVWCLIGAKDVRTMADLPDGTPCGTGKYCLRGECMSLTCSKQTIVANQNDCPAPTIPRKDPIAKREIITAPITGIWENWTPWSGCVVADCSSTGIKERNRTCTFKDKEARSKNNEEPNCLGAKRQRSECGIEC